MEARVNGSSSPLPHLHLHLEPEERKRRMTGSGVRPYTSADEFLAVHDLAYTGRLAMAASDLPLLLRQVHAEQRRQGIQYVELRLSPRRFLADGFSWEWFIQTCHAAMQELTDPVVRGVLLVNRDSPVEFIKECEDRIRDGLPPTFVGIDLAGDERRYPDVSFFCALYDAARKAGLGCCAHAGEFGDERHVWRAIDELGARRIGHAVAAGASRQILGRLARERILIEVCLWSNLTLGVVDAATVHPVLRFLDGGIPVSFNSDVPMTTGRDFSDEVSLASLVLLKPEDEVLSLQRAAYSHAFTA